MFKFIAIAAVASASPVPATTMPHNVTDNTINKAANIADHTAQRGALIEMNATKNAFKAVSKYAKLSALQGQYSDYKFVKHVFWRASKTLHYLGPKPGCKAGVFARCVAQQSANRTRFDDDEFDFSKATRRYPVCTARSGCAATISTMNAAQKATLQAKARKSDNYLRTLVRNKTRSQVRIFNGLQKKMERIGKNAQAKHMRNAEAGADRILSNFGCNKTCFMQTSQRTHNLERAWKGCGCQSPVDIKFSPEEVLQMMSEHNMDVNAGIDEEEVEFTAEPTNESAGTWGWMSFGALATANAAYIAVKKN